MLALYLIASHMVGDFVFQTRWQAAGKLDDWLLRLRHVFFYMCAFAPLILWKAYALPSGRSWHAPLFFVLLGVLHFLTDSRRFHSTLGDVFGWYQGGRITFEQRPRMVQLPDGNEVATLVQELSGPHRWPPPNPWPAMPLMIDQTLHVVQLAALGWLLA